MSRYVDADTFDDTVQKLNEKGWRITNIDYKRMDRVLFEMPTADVVDVVRCEDCKWLDIYTINGEDITACNNENAFFRDVRCDEHCSCGERREDG